MTIIRNYDEGKDAQAVGILIAETYRDYNLGFAAPEEQARLLGPFCYAWSNESVHMNAITSVLRAEMIFVAEDDGQIVGILRCRPGRLQSLFVRGDRHRQGIGRSLVQLCEHECASRGSKVLHVAATIFAIPFYASLGYKKSTGIRNYLSFGVPGMMYQPMVKVLGEITSQSITRKPENR